MKRLTLAAIALLGTVPVFADTIDMPALPPQLQEKVAAAAAACAEFDSGIFDLEWGAVKRVDLDGDRMPDWVLDESGFLCSTAVSLYCGTGGCMSHFLVSDVLQSQLNQGWEVVTGGPHRVVIADLHGSLCNGINPTPCFSAATWDSEAQLWRSTSAGWE